MELREKIKLLTAYEMLTNLSGNRPHHVLRSEVALRKDGDTGLVYLLLAL